MKPVGRMAGGLFVCGLFFVRDFLRTIFLREGARVREPGVRRQYIFRTVKYFF